MVVKLSHSRFSLFCAAALAAIAVIYPDTAHAQALFDSGTNFLTAVQDLLTSTWARIIAIIAVVCLGFAWMLGRITLSIALSIVGGIILVFGAPSIVDSIAGNL